MKFIATLWGARRREQSQALQERIARFTVYPPHRNVQAVVVKPPLKKDGKRA